MFNTAYETLPCRSYPMGEITNALQRADVGGQGSIREIIRPAFSTTTDHKDLTMRTAVVLEGTPGIGIFAHPIVIEMLGSNIFKAMVDARDVTKLDYNGEMKVSSQPEFNLIRGRVILQSKWSMGYIAGLESLPYHSFPMAIFADWISDSLARRFNLDLEAAVQVKALAAFMYLSMHQRKKEFQDYELVEIVTKIGHVTNVPVNMVNEVISEPIYFDDINDFCEAVATRIPRSRLADLNPVVLYSIIKGSWFGKNSAELAAVAVEHPPTFDALVYAAASVSSFQRTILGGLVKQELRNRDALTFVEKINKIILDKE